MDRLTAATAEFSRLLRRRPSCRDVLRALRLTPLSVPELAVVLRGDHRPGTLRSACLTLRAAGVVGWTGRRIRRAKVWRIV